jgi:hypothetical protein
MAQDERRSDDLDREEPDRADDVRGVGDDEDEFEEGEDSEEADEEEYDADERLTGEIGSEGGSPGETVTTRRDRTDEPLQGSESTTTSRRNR